MAYIGHSPTNAGTFYILDDLTMGAGTTYGLAVGGVSVSPSADNLLITLDGVIQHPGDAYTISGSNIVFATGPGSDVEFYGIIMGQSASTGQGSIGADELKVSGDGSSGQVLTSDGDGTFSWATDTENYLPLAGGTMSGAINLGSQNVTNGGTITGTFVGNITGNVTGNTSGTAATVTGGTQASITSAANLATVGTLTAGTWNAGVIASAYLDADTAHLSGTQTFSGAKTFTDGVHFKGSAWNDIMIIGDTSRSNEEETHIRNGEVNFSISVNDGTYAAFAANHDGSAMTLGGDFGSGTLTVVPSTTFTGNITTAGGMIITQADGSNTDAYFGLGNDADYGQIGANEIGLWNVNNNDIIFGTNNNLRMTIKNDGNVTIGDNASGVNRVLSITAHTDSIAGIDFSVAGSAKWALANSSGDELYVYDHSDTSVAANIGPGDNDWQAGSDLRIKKDIVNIDSTLDKINELRPITWKRKYGKLDRTYPGLVAQEVLPHFPLVVGGTEDSFEEITEEVEGEEIVTSRGGLSIGYNNLVPYLIKAIQELSEKLDIANSKIEALENA